jgi:polyphosphate glucokinase
MEFAHHPVAEGMTYEQYLGAAAFRQVGGATWNRRLDAVLQILEALMRPDAIYVSGGNALNIVPELARKLTLGDRNAGLRGGFGLWRTADISARRGNCPCASRGN